MSKLRDHLEKQSIRQSDFAARIGATQGMVSRLINGVLLPSLKMAIAIERETCGAVPANSWSADPPGVTELESDTAVTPAPDEDAA